MTPSIFDLDERVSIVTGAGRGIGKAIALALADAGAHVVVAARTASEIEAVASEIRARGRKSLAVPTDVRLSDQVDNLAQRAQGEMGRVDILVNNAGGSFTISTLNMSEGGWDAILRENLKSVFLCSKAAAQVMREQRKGVIINIASIAGIAAYQVNAAYGAAKAGIINFTRTLALDLAPYNIRVNAIAPGFIETEGVRQAYRGPSGSLEQRLARIPRGRLGSPEDIAAGVIYLATDAADFVTGETLVIDGGMMCDIIG